MKFALWRFKYNILDNFAQCTLDAVLFVAAIWCWVVYGPIINCQYLLILWNATNCAITYLHIPSICERMQMWAALAVCWQPCNAAKPNFEDQQKTVPRSQLGQAHLLPGAIYGTILLCISVRVCRYLSSIRIRIHICIRIFKRILLSHFFLFILNMYFCVGLFVVVFLLSVVRCFCFSFLRWNLF